MGFFQDTVVHKYLKANDANLISQAYAKFGEHFHNPRIQENIRNSKEEQYQGEFLIDLFVKVLGYTKNPNDNFNLTTEYKNIKDSKKADGAILVNGTVKAVIELKGTNTTDLGKVEEQAFGYKNNQPECIYVITSNFEKLRLYIDNAIEHIEFNLFTLDFKEFELLYLCLAFENIEKNIPKKIKDESLSEEDVITKKLYKDYSIFKSELFNNIVTLNPGINPIDLFQKTQKLIDRFLFLFFAEDRSLLPPNSVRLILSDWRDLQDRDEDIGLYDRFKKYFEYLNTGYKGKRYEVFAYNGGLFKLDEILDVIKIDSDLLYKHTLKLSEYNFNSEVDVNILGHIFENSLNELDELKAQSEGEAIDRKKTRRKKDGVFYTPKYITKYIVDNTVGKLCLEKKQEIDIRDEDYVFDKKRPKKNTLNLVEKLNLYKAWLLEITICDPACGSGAFLNQALDFLIKEHKYIDELQAKLLGETLVFSDIEKSILEKNLYGVDINEESVEIAKLSLWLRTAQPNRKLNDLNNNIKCGNSLIDDPEVAGDKAFNWQNEFPDIFSKGGFDVVIGNPPYLRIQGLKDLNPKLTRFYETNYISSSGNYDIYVLFIEKSFKLINNRGEIALILPHKFLISEFGRGIRNFLLNNKAVSNIVHFGSELIFKDATTYTCIISLTKKVNNEISVRHILPSELFENAKISQIPVSKLTEERWILSSDDNGKVLNKLNKQPLKLKDVFSRFVQGIITGRDAVYCVKGNIKGKYLEVIANNGKKYLLENSILKPHLRGEDIGKYKYLSNNEWLIFPYKLNSSKAAILSPAEFQETFPNTLEYLRLFEQELRNREGNKFNNDFWYQYSRNQAISVLEQPKIITPEVCYGGSMTLDENNFYHNSKCHTLLLSDTSEYKLNSILPLINSKLFWFYLSKTGNVLRGGYIGVKRQVLELFPIPVIVPPLFTAKGEVMLSLNKDLIESSNKFKSTLKRKFEIETLPNKLNNWYQLTYTDFIKELSKLKVKISLSEEAEWEEYFNTERKKVLDVLAEIETTDKEIDQMVYSLYKLTEEEIRIVES